MSMSLHEAWLNDLKTNQHLRDLLVELRNVLPAAGYWVPCPRCLVAALAPWDSTVMHLNDVHEWSREDIADWLEVVLPDLTLEVKS
jgi:hypothetical protein